MKKINRKVMVLSAACLLAACGTKKPVSTTTPTITETVSTTTEMTTPEKGLDLSAMDPSYILPILHAAPLPPLGDECPCGPPGVSRLHA